MAIGPCVSIGLGIDGYAHVYLPIGLGIDGYRPMCIYRARHAAAARILTTPNDPD
jgi:hypothetical protein